LIDTSKAIRTVATVIAHPTVITAHHVSAIKTSVAIVTIRALIYKLAFEDKIIIDIIFPVKRKRIVITILVVMAPDIHVAIFIICLKINIIAVDAICPANQCNDWHRIEKLVKLLKKRPRKINIPAIQHWIKIITIKTFATIDRTRLILRPDGYYRFFTFVALARIQIPLIAK